ncbi:hypothetical protein pb186bvf_001918 [Paramecium bursaria]
MSQDESEILFNVKQCEELFQKDKSDKLLKDIQDCKESIMNAKEAEKKYYQKIRLEDKEKYRIFGIQEKSKFPGKKKNMIIVWDPLKGNLIMTDDEYSDIYLKNKPL